MLGDCRVDYTWLFCLYSTKSYAYKYKSTIVRSTRYTLNELNLSMGWYIDFHDSSHLKIYKLYTNLLSFLFVLILKLINISGDFIQFSSVQLLSRVRLFATPWIAACQASLSITISWSSLKLTCIELVMPSHPQIGRASCRERV